MSEPLSTQIYNLLVDHIALVIATIISHEGSTPRTSGTKMIITGDGRLSGTIGGGLLEARVIEKAVHMINADGTSTFMPFHLNYEDIDSMDMICGGQADIFLDVILPSAANIALFKSWHQVSQKRDPGVLITTIQRRHHQIAQVDHCVMDQRQVVAGNFPLQDEVLSGICREARQCASLTVKKMDEAWVIIEPSFRPMSAFLFGAGHVAKPTAHLCALTGFHVTVLDDRQAFAHVDHFPDAHRICALENFEQGFANLNISPRSFIVIFTRGHLHDKTVLAGALKTSACYIGMIGSRKKRDSIFKALLNTGYTQTDLNRVHSPIGLAIGAQTPEEIAVSIVAEMIQERARVIG
jgi:xanthine dehydrogenase accessory factor